MERRHGGLIAAMVLLLSVGAGLALPAITAQPENERISTEELLAILAGTQTRVNEVFGSLEQRGVVIPTAAYEARAEGIALAQEAVQLQDAGQPAAAHDLAAAALERFRAAIANLPPEDTLEAQVLACLRTSAAVERLEAVLTTLEPVSARAQAAGLASLEERLSRARAALASVPSLCTAENVGEVAQQVGAAQAEVDLLLNETAQLAKEEKRTLAQAFLEVGRLRLAEVEALLVGLPLPPPARDLVQAALNQAASLLAQAEELLAEGEVDAAVPVLQAMSERIEEARERANGPP